MHDVSGVGNEAGYTEPEAELYYTQGLTPNFTMMAIAMRANAPHS